MATKERRQAKWGDASLDIKEVHERKKRSLVASAGRVFREKGGRGGKVVTVVRGLPGDLAEVARDLKRHCGSGGAVKADAVEIQGDHRDKVVARLQAQGHRVKAAGG